MTQTKKAIILTIALTALLTFGWAQRAGGVGDTIHPAEEVPVTTATTTKEKTEAPKKTAPAVQPVLAEDRETWLAALIQCESNGRPEAVNPKDRDGTPSYGLLQFKPSTFEMFSRAYGIEGELMNPEAQTAIVIRMMDDKSVVWENQFPACVRKLGRPPQQ